MNCGVMDNPDPLAFQDVLDNTPHCHHILLAVGCSVIPRNGVSFDILVTKALGSVGMND